MQAIEQFLLDIVHFFTGNWIAAAILGAVVIFTALKKPKLLFQTVSLIVAGVIVLYIMMYLEGSLFSGVSSKERAYDVERKAN